MDIDVFDEELQQALGAVAPSLLEATAQALKDAGIVRGDDVRIATDAQLRECGVSLGAVNSLRRTLGPTGGGGQGRAPPQPGPGEASQPHRRGLKDASVPARRMENDLVVPDAASRGASARHEEGVEMMYGMENATFMRRVTERCSCDDAFRVELQEDPDRASAVLTVTVRSSNSQSSVSDAVQVGFGISRGGVNIGVSSASFAASRSSERSFLGVLRLNRENPEVLLRVLDLLPQIPGVQGRIRALEDIKSLLAPQQELIDIAMVDRLRHAVEPTGAITCATVGMPRGVELAPRLTSSSPAAESSSISALSDEILADFEPALARVLRRSLMCAEDVAALRNCGILRCVDLVLCSHAQLKAVVGLSDAVADRLKREMDGKGTRIELSPARLEGLSTTVRPLADLHVSSSHVVSEGVSAASMGGIFGSNTNFTSQEHSTSNSITLRDTYYPRYSDSDAVRVAHANACEGLLPRTVLSAEGRPRRKDPSRWGK